MSFLPIKRSTVGNIIFSFLILGCSTVEPEIGPQDQGLIENQNDKGDTPDGPRTYNSETFTIGDISIEIYIPSDYEEGKSYPTIYLNDGDSFGDIFGRLTSLDADPFIMVGLWDNNTRAARFSAYEDESLTTNYGNFIPSAESYTQAIIDEVIPYVEDKYRSSKRALFGISLGGLHATWTGIHYPGVFNFTGALSPAYWVGDRAMLEESLTHLLPDGPSVPSTFYFDRGTEEWRNFLILVERLKQVNLTYGQNLFYYEDIGADHDSPYWQLRMDIPFRLFMEGPEDLIGFEVSGYCADNYDTPGIKEPRINPIVTYSNSIRFSVMTETEFTVISGDGSVAPDGVYTINSGASITVQCSYMGFSDQIEVFSCN